MQENNKKIKKNEKKYPISALIHPIGCFVTGH